MQATMIGVMSPVGPLPAPPEPAAPAPPPAAPPAAPAAPAAGGAGRGFQRTMLGIASPVVAPPLAAPPPGASPPAGADPAAAGPMSAGAPSAARPSLQRTMLGVASPVLAAAPASPAPQAPPAAPPAPGGRKGATMIMGQSPLLSPGAAPPMPAAPHGGPVPARGGQTLLGVAAPAGLGGGKKTLLGMMAPGGAGGGGGKKTLLGMAFPSLGAAPVLPTVTEPEYVEEVYEELVPETGQVERRVRRVAREAPPSYRRGALLALGGAGVLLVGGILAVIFARTAAPLVAEARLDAAGKDQLHLTCKSCPDETRVALGAASATVKNGEADLPLAEPLKIGKNPVSIAIDRPANGRDETAQLEVPVAYRIAADLNALQDATPAVQVLVEALPGTVVSVQGKPATLDAAGKGSVRVDVADKLRELPLEARSFEQEIPYTIAPQGGSPESGKLSVRIGIVTLTIESPGLNLVTEQATFLLAGRVPKGAGVVVAGSPVAINADGSFKQFLKIPGMGLADVPLRASAHGMAPRLHSLRVKLVKSLAEEAKEAEATRKVGFGDVASRGEGARGQLVAWKAEVISAAAQPNQIAAIVEVATGCPKKPCRARVVIPGGAALNTGEKVSIYGRVTGQVVAGESKLPDLEADFVVKGP
jgi:hypothetical protein